MCPLGAAGSVRRRVDDASGAGVCTLAGRDHICGLFVGPGVEVAHSWDALVRCDGVSVLMAHGSVYLYGQHGSHSYRDTNRSLASRLRTITAPWQLLGLSLLSVGRLDMCCASLTPPPHKNVSHRSNMCKALDSIKISGTCGVHASPQMGTQNSPFGLSFPLKIREPANNHPGEKWVAQGVGRGGGGLQAP